ncbi:MAG: hypothetical protein K5793_07845 [Nitrosarchaeum sp.]|nr:hypothetical protein [Nitrosarchaeum sp.]MCV0399563.1 hypothetical protein [Nitrosarchaeum sp.]
MVLGYEQTPTVTEKFKSIPKKRTAHGQSPLGGIGLKTYLQKTKFGKWPKLAFS